MPEMHRDECEEDGMEWKGELGGGGRRGSNTKPDTQVNTTKAISGLHGVRNRIHCLSHLFIFTSSPFG